MINYNKNKLINKTLDKYYETFSHTLDTVDFVPEKFNKNIYKYIYKNMKQVFKKIDKEDRVYQKNMKQKLKLKTQEEQASQNKPTTQLALFFKRLFSRKRSDFVKDEAESEQCERINSESDLCSALDKEQAN